MKCISLKKFIIILLMFSILIIITTYIITSIHYNNKCEIEDEIYDEHIIKENIEDDLITNENEYMDLLLKKYEEKKLLALTFDDGPSKYTHDLIDELNKRNIKATFFVLGENIEKYPDTLKFAIDSGNEIGIHSYKHKLFTKLTEKEILEQIDLTRDLIYEISQIDISYIRVPYGSINNTVKNIIEKECLTNVLWDVDSLDWRFKNKNKTYSYMIKKITGNDVILMHDSFKTSIDAAVSLIDKLTSQGFVFVKVSELMEFRKIDINS